HPRRPPRRRHPAHGHQRPRNRHPPHQMGERTVSERSDSARVEATPSSASLREAPSPTRGEGGTGLPESTPESLASFAPLSPRGRRDGGEGAAAPSVPAARSDKTHRLRERRNRGFAKSMRRNPTEAEQKLWLLLKDRRFAEYKFRRQVPIGPFIADF